MATAKAPTKSELEAEIAELKKENEILSGETSMKRRTRWSIALVVIAVISLALGNVALYANRIVLNNQRYTEAITPLASDPKIQQAVQKYAYTELTNRIDFQQQVKDVLPPKAEILAGPIATQLKSFTNDAIGRVVRSQQFSDVWVQANSHAQKQLVAVIKSDAAASGKLDMSDLYGFISQKLQGTPLAFVANQQLPAGIGQIQVLNSTALKGAHNGVKYLGWTLWLTIILAFAAIAGAIWASPRRWNTVRTLGWATALSMAITGIVFWIGRQVALHSIGDSVYHQAAVQAWNIMTRGLYHQLIVTGVIGIALLALGWVMLWRNSKK